MHQNMTVRYLNHRNPNHVRIIENMMSNHPTAEFCLHSDPRHIDTDNKYIGLIDDSWSTKPRLVGICAITEDKEGTEQDCVLSDVYLTPSYHRDGYGRTFIETALLLAAPRYPGECRVELSNIIGEDATFYKQCGFEVSALSPSYDGEMMPSEMSRPMPDNDCNDIICKSLMLEQTKKAVTAYYQKHYPDTPFDEETNDTIAVLAESMVMRYFHFANMEYNIEQLMKRFDSQIGPDGKLKKNDTMM